MKFQCAANKRKHTIKEPVAGMSWLRFHTWILRRGGTRSKSLLRQGFFLQRQTRIRGMMLAPFTKSMCHESLSRVFPACTYSRKYLDFNIIFNWFDPATILRICVRVYCICARMRFSLSLFSLSRCLAVPLSHCHTAWLSVYLSICLSVCLSICLSVCPSVFVPPCSVWDMHRYHQGTLKFIKFRFSQVKFSILCLTFCLKRPRQN